MSSKYQAPNYIYTIIAYCMAALTSIICIAVFLRMSFGIDIGSIGLGAIISAILGLLINRGVKKHAQRP